MLLYSRCNVDKMSLKYVKISLYYSRTIFIDTLQDRRAIVFIRVFGILKGALSFNTCLGLG